MLPNSNKGNSYSIYHDLPIAVTPQRVFAAVSEPRHLENWWPLRCGGHAEIGASYNFFFAPEYDWHGRVSQCEPPHHFHIEMTDADADWTPTSFGFDIIATEGGSQLRFSHIGWPERNDHFRRSSYCWAILLKGLKDYLESGKIIPFEERE